MNCSNKIAAKHTGPKNTFSDKGIIQTIALFAISFVLAACGSSPSKVNNALNETPINKPVSITQTESALERIARTFATSEDMTLRNAALVDLANDYAQQSDCVSSNIILKNIDNSISAVQTRSKSNLLKAECALQKSAFVTANLNDASLPKHPLIPLLESWLVENSFSDPQWQQRNTIAKAHLHQLKAQYAQAISVLFMSMSINDVVQVPELSNKIWAWFSMLNTADRQSTMQRFRVFEEHYAVLQIIEDTALSDSQRQNSIRQWLSQYPLSFIGQNLPTQISRYLSLASTQEGNQGKTAVLLPLSGRLASQGNAIKQGVLAAYFERVKSLAPSANDTSGLSIEFLDTGSLNNMNDDINAEYLSQFETIIGPLLKSHVEELATFSLDNQKKVLLNQAQVVLNDEQSVHTFYALSPEQEAQQLAKLMRDSNIQFPVLIQDNSNVAKRMQVAFEQAWLNMPTVASSNPPLQTQTNNEQTKRSVQVINYTDNKSMRIGITAALDVLQSQRRIAQLNNLSNETVLSVTRNRRDVDAFVVFAKPDDVELINPIIESSISLFTGQQIPVFATSYSYDHKQNKNTQRDLRNLIFIDMPWLLPAGREQALSMQVDSLFNQPPSAFLRLFAFGYDALLISDNMAQLSTFKHMHVSGLTGTLSILDNDELNRELSSLSITNNVSGD